MQPKGHSVVAIVVLLASGASKADNLLYRYEADVLPYDPSAGWSYGNPCEDPCTESLADGYYVLEWPVVGDRVNRGYGIDPVPESLWVEWRFRSNHPIPTNFYTCDGHFTIVYLAAHELVNLYGDAGVSGSGDDVAFGLDMEEFHTYRFESLNGADYWVSVDGEVFTVGTGHSSYDGAYLQFGGRGGCLGDWIPNMVNEWDFIRFGTISYGERIIRANPWRGYLDADETPPFDRFTVRFGSPNYVYLDEITVDVSGGIAPGVLQTRRLDNGDAETVEIVLDVPIPAGEHTRFTFDDGEAISVVDYSYLPGDAHADGHIDLADVAVLQNCFGRTPVVSMCRAFDLDDDGALTLDDFAALRELLGRGP